MRRLVLLISMLALAGCTENEMARSFGGTMTVNVPCGEKVFDITWKGNADLWYATRPMREGEEPETYYFREQPGAAIRVTGGGTVVLKECSK